MARTASAGSTSTAGSPGNDGETPAGATATNSTATHPEAPANGTSNEAIDIDAANDATVEGSGTNDNDDDWSIGEEVPALSNLDRIRGEMTLEGIERNARAKSTFTTRQNENQLFILWLYHHAREFVDEGLVSRLNTVIENVEYSPLMRTGKYKYKGKKSLTERKVIHLKDLCRKAIDGCLGRAGAAPPHDTVKLVRLTEGDNYKIFVEYLAKRRKKNGGLMKPSVYKGYRSSLSFLFFRYGIAKPQIFDDKVRNAMMGIKRIANRANQRGEGDIGDGKRPLTFELYQKMNELFLGLGTHEGFFGHAFSKATFNLACRGDSTGQIHTMHLQWSGDAVGIPFAHSKEAQTGADPTKRLPRHCYSNPLDQTADFSSAIFGYLATHPEILAKPDGPLFPGTMDAQTQRFRDVLKLVLLKHKDMIEKDFAFNIGQIGVHSWRKAAHTKLNCGSTAGPTSAAACIRGGHSIGSTRDVYVVQEKASDEYCGKILAGLPEHSAEFSVSYPDFIPIDLEKSVTDGVSDDEYDATKAEVDDKVSEALASIFCKEHLDNFPTINRFLVIGLASHLNHLQAIEKLLPDNSKLRHTPLFTSSLVAELKQHVRVAMPWENHYKYFSPATGIPPHIMNYRYFEEIKTILKNIPNELDAKLDARQMNGQVSLAQMKQMFEGGELMQSLARDIKTLKRTALRADEDEGGNREPRQKKFKWHVHGDGMQRRVPATWTFPMLALQHMYQQWHCGNEAMEIPPMKYFDNVDVSFLGSSSRVRLNEVKQIMQSIDKAATSNGTKPKRGMTLAEATTCFNAGRTGINIPTTTLTGRRREIGLLKWTSVMKYLPKKKRARAN